MPRRIPSLRIRIPSFIICLSILFLIFTSPVAATDEQISSSQREYAKIGGSRLPIGTEMRPWSGEYLDLLSDDNMEKSSSGEKRASGFYPLRGKKGTDYSPENEVGMLLPLPGKEKKKGMAFVPLRGRKATAFVPTRGRKASAFLPMRGKKDNQEEETSTFWQKRAEEDDGQLLDHMAFDPSKSSNVNNLEVVMQQDYKRDDDALMSEAMDKRGSGFFGSRGKRRVFPFVTTWRVFQRLQAADRGGSKREALFFASRGKRSPAGSTR